jgi:two-component system, NtrC family, response regulator HydG
MARILVVDDKEMMRDSLSAILVRAGHEASCASGAGEALRLAQKTAFDAIVSDMKMPKMDGLGFLDGLRRSGIETPVVMMTAYATIDTAVEAMRKGAYDYIQKPFEADEILLLLERLMEHSRAMKENQAYQTSVRDWQRGRQLIGNSPAMQEVMKKIDLVAQTNATVFIHGESGTGKEMFARAIHARSPRRQKPMLCVNCAALSSTLLESEMFGHEKGAFTGADQQRIGRFELADGGTLLLDEISEMTLPLQAKLLRVLQEREFERVGSSTTRQVDVRVIATTNRDLELWVSQGKFREDLFYRLNVVPITLPPLRQRPEDIEPLCEYFLRRSADHQNTPLRILSQSALELFRQYRWPGNVRELENLMERVSILSLEDVITAEAIKGWLGMEDSPPLAEMPRNDVTLDAMERDLIQQTLDRFKGHRRKTAESLGIGLRTLGMKLKRWKMESSSA